MNTTYKTRFGFHNYVKVWTDNLLLTAALVAVVMNFDKNPNGLSVVIAVILVVLARIKTERLIIKDHHIEYDRRYFYGLVPVTTYIQKDELEEIQIAGNRDLNDNIILNFFSFKMKLKNRITFTYKNNSRKSFKTNVFLNELNWFKEEYYRS